MRVFFSKIWSFKSDAKLGVEKVVLLRSELASWQLYFPQLPSFKHVRHFPKNPQGPSNGRVWLNLHRPGGFIGPQISAMFFGVRIRILRVDPEDLKTWIPTVLGHKILSFSWELSWTWLNRQKAVMCEASLAVFVGCCQHCLKRYNVGWSGGPTANPMVPRFNEELLGRRLWSPIFESPNDSSKKIRSKKGNMFNQTIPKSKKDGEFPKEKPNHIAQYFARA